jgi:hypothetical protein
MGAALPWPFPACGFCSSFGLDQAQHAGAQQQKGTAFGYLISLTRLILSLGGAGWYAAALPEGAGVMCCSGASLVTVPAPAGALCWSGAPQRARARTRRRACHRERRKLGGGVRGRQSRWPGRYGDGLRARRSTRSGSWPRRTRTPPCSASVRPPRRPRPPRAGAAARRAARACRCTQALHAPLPHCCHERPRSIGRRARAGPRAAQPARVRRAAAAHAGLGP